MTFELYPKDREAEAQALFLAWFMRIYFYSDSAMSYADLDEARLCEIEAHGLANGASLNDIMSGRVAAEVLRLRREMVGFTPQELRLREVAAIRRADKSGDTRTPVEHVECAVAFALYCASEYEMTDVDWAAEEAALVVMGLGVEEKS